MHWDACGSTSFKFRSSAGITWLTHCRIDSLTANTSLWWEHNTCGDWYTLPPKYREFSLYTACADKDVDVKRDIEIKLEDMQVDG